MHVSVGIVRAIAAELSDRGIEPARFCAEAGMDPNELDDACQFVTVQAFDRVANAALKLSGDPALGLHVGANAPARSLHVVGQMLLSCRTMRDAISAYGKFSPLILPESKWTLREGPELAHYVYEHLLLPPMTSRFGTELTVALVFRLGEQFVGSNGQMSGVTFRHPEPAHVEQYERVFQLRPTFGASENQLVFDRRYLDRPQMHGDEAVFHLMRARAEQMMVERGAAGRLPDRVRDLLRYEPDLGQIDGRQIARRLGMTLRGLRRRLGEMGTPLSGLIDEVRKELACNALRDPQVCIKEVAERLGFSEPSAFHRAFKRWTGETPAQWRASNASPALQDVG